MQALSVPETGAHALNYEQSERLLDGASGLGRPFGGIQILDHRDRSWWSGTKGVTA